MTDKSNGSPAAGQLYELREWLLDRIDGGEETRGEDSLISGFIAEIDALKDQIGSLTKPKTIAEWVAANKYVEPTPTPQSKTQQKRFAAQSEPRGCPTPGACSAVAEQTRLRQMAEHERDSMLEELIAARSSTGATSDIVNRILDNVRKARLVDENFTEHLDLISCGVGLLVASSLPVEVGAIRDAALEEAAKEVDWHACRYLDSHLKAVAAGVRALKGRDMKGEKP